MYIGMFVFSVSARVFPGVSVSFVEKTREVEFYGGRCLSL